MRNTDLRWDWGVFWIHGCIAFFVGFLSGFFINGLIAGILTGLISGLLAGIMGDRFWKNIAHWIWS